jgi:hypothetical protein
VLVSLGVEPPAGIEPATPSLPSMVGPFGRQRGTSLRSTEPQVTGPIGDREVGCCEAVCGAAAGKSLARMQIIHGPGRARESSHARQPPTVQGVLAGAVLAAQVGSVVQPVRS